MKSSDDLDALLRSQQNRPASCEPNLDLFVLSYITGNPSIDTHRGLLILQAHSSPCYETPISSTIDDDTVKKLVDNEMNDNRLLDALWCCCAVLHNIPDLPLSDLCEFIGNVFSSHITHAQVLAIYNSPGAAHSYAIALKLSDSHSAAAFVREFNGRPFNQLEDTPCMVSSLRAVIRTDSTPPALYNIDSKLPPEFLICNDSKNCPVCLEPIQPLHDGMITILCHHIFHFSCLAKWTDYRCPVCRYIMTPSYESKCEKCENSENVWLCLICGYVGCGRYVGGHSLQHFKQTGHTYALECETQRVWDYSQDDYVHRLIQNISDGKPVEFVARRARGVCPQDDLLLQKMDALITEYTFLLSSQLEIQRKFFVNQINLAEEKRESTLKSLNDQNTSLDEEIERLNREIQENEAIIENVESKTKILESEIETESKALSSLEKLNRLLSVQQTSWRNKMSNLDQHLREEAKRAVTSLELAISSLQEQVQDLEFYLSTQKKVASNPKHQKLVDTQVKLMAKP